MLFMVQGVYSALSGSNAFIQLQFRALFEPADHLLSNTQIQIKFKMM